MKYITIILALFLISCQNGKNSPLITVNATTHNGEELTKLSDIATDVQYIPLETVPEALMRFVNYLKSTDDKFYINTVREILCFDKSGKFLYKLDQQGRGPNEYIYLSDFDINPETKQMIVLTRGKLYFYDETSTGFQMNGQLDLSVQPNYCDFIPGQENILLSYTSSTGENKYQCVCITPKGDTLFTRPNYYAFTRNSKVVMGFSADNIINRNDDILRMKCMLTDTMFTLTRDNSFAPFMILNTEGKALNADFLANVPAPTAADGGSPAAAFLMMSAILETDRYLCYRVFYQKEGFWGVYDKKSDESRWFDVKNLPEDDISGGVKFEPKFSCNGVIYGVTDAMTFKKFMSGNESSNADLKNPERAATLRKLAESVKEDDNFILIAVTPRK